MIESKINKNSTIVEKVTNRMVSNFFDLDRNYQRKFLNSPRNFKKLDSKLIWGSRMEKLRLSFSELFYD